MALDPLEKDQLRQRMATRMGMFLESGTAVSCVSGHFAEEPVACELCQTIHGHDLLVIKNRSGKKLHVDASCLREMIRFKVTDVDDLPRWLDKIKELKQEAERRKLDQVRVRLEERKRLEKKVIVRKRAPHQIV